MKLRDRIILASIAFVVVCAMGLIVASAGGIQWGNMSAGFMTFITLVMASFAFFGVIAYAGDKL